LLLIGYEQLIKGWQKRDPVPIIDGILLIALSIYSVSWLKSDHGLWGLAIIFVLHLLNKKLPLSVGEPKKLVIRTIVYGSAIFLIRLILVVVNLMSIKIIKNCLHSRIDLLIAF